MEGGSAPQTVGAKCREGSRHDRDCSFTFGSNCPPPSRRMAALDDCYAGLRWDSDCTRVLLRLSVRVRGHHRVVAESRPENSTEGAVGRAAIPLGLLVCVGMFAALAGPKRVDHLEFFSAASGVIPVTFLAFVVQFRLYGVPDVYRDERLRRRDSEDAPLGVALTLVFAVGLMIVMAVGELAAFYALRPISQPRPTVASFPFRSCVGLRLRSSTFCSVHPYPSELGSRLASAALRAAVDAV